jgi:5'-methylthioadenosine phosphorylase
MEHRIGVIGGSGLYNMEGLTDVREVTVETPFGPPSDALVVGRLGDVEMVFLPRHGRGHMLTPSEVPYRANIWALKSLGVGWVLSVSAVGSLREEIVPGHLVVVDQFIDRTRGRASTFFGKGCVAHVAFGDPVCGTLREMLLASAKEAGATVHDGGTYVCMEGPAFSTRAESNLYRSWNASVVGMTNVPECKLAREAEMSYATLALSTDYDCWHEGHDDVSVEAVVAIVRENVKMAQRVIRKLVPRIAAHEGPPPHHDALQYAIMSDLSRLPDETRTALHPIIGKYLPESSSAE